MKLGDIEIPRAEVPLPGSEHTLTVRGLSPVDIGTIYTACRDSVEDLFKTFRESGEQGLESVAREVVENHTGLAGWVIAVANDSPEEAVKAASLPTVTQLQAIQEIVRLTLASTADVKKILSALLRGAEAAADLMEWTGPGTTNDSPSGSGKSAESPAS